MTSLSPARPSHTGLPGLIATLEKTSSSPSGSNMALAKSFSPTDAPPVTTTTSACRMRGAAADRIAGRSSRRRVRPVHRRPIARPEPPLRADTLSGIVSGNVASGAGSASSSPVLRIVQPGLAIHFDLGEDRPPPQRRSRARSSSPPAASNSSPVAEVRCRGCGCAGQGQDRHAMIAMSPSRRTFSWMTTRSAPGARGAPVKMRTQVPGATSSRPRLLRRRIRR